VRSLCDRAVDGSVDGAVENARSMARGRWRAVDGAPSRQRGRVDAREERSELGLRCSSMASKVDWKSDGAAELAALPFAPGEAPFRVKGTAYRGHLEYVEQHVEGGIAAMCDAFDDPRHGEFFRQPFLAASLYDVFPLAVGGVICGRLTGQPYLEFVRVRAQAQARSDLTGVYRVLLALASPQAVAARLPRLMGQYFDFGETSIEQRAANWIVATRSGLPAPIAPWYAAVSEGYSRVVLAQAGATEPHLDGVAVEPGGRRGGMDLVKLTFDIRWR
jgi:hypothetical protein